jgi:hypothetical protein
LRPNLFNRCVQTRLHLTQKVEIMLLRKDGLDVIAIPQPSHAWLSGQLARAWGNDQFAAPVPNEDVCLATELHDIGWLAWEEAPALDAGRGDPCRFLKSRRRSISGSGAKGCAAPALLAVIRRFWSRFTPIRFTRAISISPSLAWGTPRRCAAFLDEQHGLQARLAASLRDDPAYGGQASPENIAGNQRLIATLDWISLEICWGVEKETKIPDVPTAGEGLTELSLCQRKGENLVLDELILDPWPFREASVAVRAEGKRLRGRFSTQDELLHALDDAEPVLVT